MGFSLSRFPFLFLLEDSRDNRELNRRILAMENDSWENLNDFTTLVEKTWEV